MIMIEEGRGAKSRSEARSHRQWSGRHPLFDGTRVGLGWKRGRVKRLVHRRVTGASHADADDVRGLAGGFRVKETTTGYIAAGDTMMRRQLCTRCLEGWATATNSARPSIGRIANRLMS